MESEPLLIGIEVLCIYKFVAHMKKNFPTIFIQYNKFNFYTD